MRARVYVVGAVGLLAAAAVGVAVVGRHMAETAPDFARRVGRPIPVMTATATYQDLTEVLGATGEATSNSLVELTAGVRARILEVSVEVGDAVKAGQPVCRFATRALDAAAARAETELEQATGDRARAELYRDRVHRVVERRMLAVEKLERAETALAAALVHESRAQERLVQSRLELSLAVVRAPAAGLVAERHVNPGETPKVGAPLVAIERIDPILVAAQVAEEDLGKIRLGQAARVTFGAFGGEVHQGEVVRLDPVADAKSRTLRAFVRLANSDLHLRPGLSALVHFERTISAALVVPSVALISPTGPPQGGVFVVTHEGVARFRNVRTGASGGGLTQVVEGLEEGERVVTAGQIDLRDGDHVTIGTDLASRPENGSESRQ